MTIDPGLIPQYRLEYGPQNNGTMIDRLNGTHVTLPWDVGEVAAFCCRAGVRHLEIDPTGSGFALAQAMESWGGVNILKKRKPVTNHTVTVTGTTTP